MADEESSFIFPSSVFTVYTQEIDEQMRRLLKLQELEFCSKLSEVNLQSNRDRSDSSDVSSNNDTDVLSDDESAMSSNMEDSSTEDSDKPSSRENVSDLEIENNSYIIWGIIITLALIFLLYIQETRIEFAFIVVENIECLIKSVDHGYCFLCSKLIIYIIARYL